jgi:putative phage-type endonuclease
MEAELQRTQQWYFDKLGKVSATGISDILTKGRSGKPSKVRHKYLERLVMERILGERFELDIMTLAMQRGMNEEIGARNAYEFQYNLAVEQVGFVDHPSIAMSGASPDGLVGDDGLIEIKNPNSETHMHSIINKEIDIDYIRQMQWQMACTGRQWCDFTSYDSRYPAHLQLNVKRVYRDDDLIAELQTAVIEFIGEVENALGFLEAA